ncbi:zinc metalloprotease [Alkaliphilus serpentinus]|uniref:Matrixin n=1 Tax=Alkaliphilus serpentinus TaxID=1482731 RepID=A0A833MF76_9FIRM|nr:hypothetical protein [Alkaliphilus serpentinus]KAB3533083.1 hypothetical protein F8153_00605 [Alkaliphilus serpentinus]
MKKLIRPIPVVIIIVLMFSSITYGYVHISTGMPTTSFIVENRSSYSSIFNNSIAAWNNTDTSVELTKAKSDNYVITGQYDDTWYGVYKPSLKYIFWGPATKFVIQLNRSQLVGKSDNFWQSVLVHEFGHALSLGDNPPESPSIMRYDRDRESMITPQQDDIDGVNAYYNN